MPINGSAVPQSAKGTVDSPVKDSKAFLIVQRRRGRPWKHAIGPINDTINPINILIDREIESDADNKPGSPDHSDGHEAAGFLALPIYYYELDNNALTPPTHNNIK